MVKPRAMSAENDAIRLARAEISATEKHEDCESGMKLSAPKDVASPLLTGNLGSSLGINSGSANRETLRRATSVRGSNSARAPEKKSSQGAELYFDGEEFWDADTEAAMQCLMDSLVKNSK